MGPAYLPKHTSGKESNDRDECYDTHVANRILDPFLNTPKDDCNDAHEGDPILLDGELFFRQANFLDYEIFAVHSSGGLVAHKQEHPYEDDGNSGDG